MRVAVYTLGCKLNQCESEAIADSFREQGFDVVHPGESGIDLYLVNTCTVTSKAEQKARRMIRKFSASREDDGGGGGFSNAEVIVTGCYAQMEADAISALDDHVTVVPLDRKAGLLTLPEHLSAGLGSGLSLQDVIRDLIAGSRSDHQPEEMVMDKFSYSAKTFTAHARAFLKIEDGCDNTCAYCRVTIARGPAVSLDLNEAVSRAQELEASGYAEIVLTGVNITAYRSHGQRLGGLLQTLLDQTKHVRYRLSSLEPDMVDDRLLAVIAHQRVRPHFHIPVQSGSDRILRNVRRSYTAEDVHHLVNRIKAIKDDPFIAADVITGLPTESDADARMTLDLLTDSGFSQIHVFPFSPRPGTELYAAAGHVTESLRDSRAEELRALSRRLHGRYISRWDGRSVEAVIEHNLSQGTATALTENYLSIRITGIPEGDAAEHPEGADLRGRACLIKLHLRTGKGVTTESGIGEDGPEGPRASGRFISWVSNIESSR